MLNAEAERTLKRELARDIEARDTNANHRATHGNLPKILDAFVPVCEKPHVLEVIKPLAELEKAFADVALEVSFF